MKLTLESVLDDELAISSPPVPILAGPRAWRRYVHFFRDPIDCMRKFHADFGPLVAMHRRWIPRYQRKLDIFAVGAEFNRRVLGNPAEFRATGQIIRGPEDSAQRRLLFGLTR